MVRRLSFINSFNKVKTHDYTFQRQSKVDKCITTVFYMRRPFFFKFTTKHQKRRQWKRRKHSFEYILYLNILSLWASEYVFCRKLIKFNYNYCIMKSSLLVYNLALLRGTSPALARNSEHTYIATLPKSLIKYYAGLNYSLFKYWYRPTSTQLTVGSFFLNDPNETPKQIWKTCFIRPSYTYSTTTLTPYTTNINNDLTNSYKELFDDFILNHHYHIITELYKIHILLTLKHTLNK